MEGVDLQGMGGMEDGGFSMLVESCVCLACRVTRDNVVSSLIQWYMIRMLL